MQRSRILFIVILTFFCFLHSVPGWAGSFLLSPKTYTWATGQPNSYTEHFFNCESQAKYNLVIQNGNIDGTKRLSNITILLNGMEVIRSHELKPNVVKVEKPVSVRSENTLEVRLANNLFGKLTVSIECIKNCLEISITPINGAITTNQILVHGEVYTGSSEVGITVNGFPALVHEQNWSYLSL